MADEEYEAIRARRMAELQGQMGGQQSEQAQAEKMKKMEDMKQDILSQVLDQSARSRLNTIAIAKPDKAKRLEAMLCQMAQQGQLPGKLNEAQLKGLLEQVSGAQKTTSVKFDRRRANIDSSDED